MLSAPGNWSPCPLSQHVRWSWRHLWQPRSPRQAQAPFHTAWHQRPAQRTCHRPLPPGLARPDPPLQPQTPSTGQRDEPRYELPYQHVTNGVRDRVVTTLHFRVISAIAVSQDDHTRCAIDIRARRSPGPADRALHQPPADDARLRLAQPGRHRQLAMSAGLRQPAAQDVPWLLCSSIRN